MHSSNQAVRRSGSAPWVNLNLRHHKRAMTLKPSLFLVGGLLIVVLRYGVR